MQMGGLHSLGALNINEYLQSAYGPGAANVTLALSQHSAAMREHGINEDVPFSGTNRNFDFFLQSIKKNYNWEIFRC